MHDRIGLEEHVFGLDPLFCGYDAQIYVVAAGLKIPEYMIGPSFGWWSSSTIISLFAWHHTWYHAELQTSPSEINIYKMGHSEGLVTNTVKKDRFTSTDDYSPKARKPYTITKQRESWTEEEHKKFIEALRLNDRAWRRIKEHVGTKLQFKLEAMPKSISPRLTTLIFLTSTVVVRESTCGNVCKVKPIEISPPRPKRKPMHPYPRKLSAPVKTRGYHWRYTSPNLSGADQEN
nr:protein REVEILLE 1-like isoform X1 [Tanacetum cinerariifolium]